jgi:hypothetical protein
VPGGAAIRARRQRHGRAVARRPWPSEFAVETGPVLDDAICERFIEQRLPTRIERGLLRVQVGDDGADPNALVDGPRHAYAPGVDEIAVRPSPVMKGDDLPEHAEHGRARGPGLRVRDVVQDRPDIARAADQLVLPDDRFLQPSVGMLDDVHEVAERVLVARVAQRQPAV